MYFYDRLNEVRDLVDGDLCANAVFETYFFLTRRQNLDYRYKIIMSSSFVCDETLRCSSHGCVHNKNFNTQNIKLLTNLTSDCEMSKIGFILDNVQHSFSKGRKFIAEDTKKTRYNAHKLARSSTNSTSP